MATTGTATVMFTDLVGSTGLRSRLGDEAADAVRRTHDTLLRSAVERCSGRLVKGLGDGGMATFAAASDAVAAACEVQQAADVHNRRSTGDRIELRIGLSAGDVLWEGDDCFGRPVIEASRLCGEAVAGQVLASDVVRLLTRSADGSRFRAAGPRELKGLDGTVETYELLWEPLPALPVAAGQPELPELLARGGGLAFAGRQSQTDAALQLWKSALAGERQALLLSGEPGIGKTRLAAEVARHAHAAGATVLYGRCEESLGAPYQPFAEALDQHVRALPPDELAPQLGRYPEELSRLAPTLPALLPELGSPLSSDAETERYRLFEAVAAWLTAAAAPRGLVLVLDDLHWAARPTLVLLQHVLHATGGARLLILGTYRDTDLGRTHPLSGLLADLRRAPDVTRMALGGLDLDGVVRLVAEAAGHELDEAGESLAAAVHAETEGNPFFVGEVLRHLRETKAVYLQDGRWVSDRSVAEIGIPEGIREVVGRRVDRLSADANAALPVAAVVGRDFQLEVVARAAGLTEDVVVAGLEEATAARLVEETGVGCYRFSHALVRSTLYDELSATRRARLHARVAEELERSSPDDVVALAHHFAAATVAGDLDKAARYSCAAGELAVEQLAHDAAVVYYAQTLELLEEAGAARDVRWCEALLGLGEAQLRTGDPAYRDTLFEAAAVATELCDDRRLVRAALTNNRGFWSIAGEVDDERIRLLEQALAVLQPGDPDRARVLGRLATELMFTDDRGHREQLTREAIAEARRTGDPLVLMDVLASTGPARYTVWTVDEGVAHTQELLAMAEEHGDPYRLTIAHLWRFAMEFFLGRDPELLEHSIASAERLAAELRQPILLWFTGVWRAMHTQMAGRLDEAAALAERAFEMGQAIGQPDAWTWYSGQLVSFANDRGELATYADVIEQEVRSSPGLPVWEVTLARTFAETGRLDEVREIVERLVDLETRTVRLPQDIVWIFGVANLLVLSVELGDEERVALLYEQLLPYGHLMTNVGVAYSGSAELQLGIGAAALGRLDDAVAHLERAVAAHERLGARIFLGRSYAELARVLAARGDHDAAQAAATQATALADETGSQMIRRRIPT